MKKCKVFLLVAYASILAALGFWLMGCAKTPKPSISPVPSIVEGYTSVTNAPAAEFKQLRLLAAIGASEAISEDGGNRKALQEISDALGVFCGDGKADSLFLITLVKNLPTRLKISDKTKRRLGLLASDIKPSDFVAWGGAGCAVREGIKRGLALQP